MCCTDMRDAPLPPSRGINCVVQKLSTAGSVMQFLTLTPLGLLPYLPLQLGRKPIGPHQQECEKNYRRVGLRDTYHTFLTTLKH